MATATKKCKVCGAEYEYCHTVRRVAGVFRWQDVACCPSHGSMYLAQIEASRSAKPVADEIAEKDVNVIEAVSDYSDLDECDGEDTWFEDDFEDETEETAI